jgi:eukaryotic-like serine/threonine-protein kinase
MTEAAPQKIGKYEIVELVGEGAMGTVYRAKDTVLGRTVAIKVMNASIARQQDHRQRFLREAQAAGSLQHPNVVTIYDMGELDGHLFIAMEFVHGTDLEKLMVGAEPLKLQSKLDIIVDVLMGLSYAHKHGIVHRDIKPANIRVEDDGRAKIMDFGVAHLASSDMTRTGLVVGTPSYMAPEQVMGGKAVAGTDLFAVGAVLYHLLTGQKPFEGPTLQSLFYRIVTDMPKPLDEVRPGLPARLNAVIQKAMAKEATDRYATALEMANDIIAVRSELSGNAYASTASLESAVTLVQSYAPKPVPIVGQEKRLPWKPIGGGAAVAAALLIGWFAFARGDGSERVVSSAAVDTSSKTPAVAVATDTPAIEAESAGSKKTLTAPPVKEAAVVPALPVTKKKPDLSAIARTKERLKKALQSSQKKAAPPTQTPPPRIVSPPTPVVVAPQQNTVTAPPAPPPVVKAPEPQPVAKPAPREEIASVVAAYARAIESRDISAVRRAYPGITGDQARGFQQFFQSTRSINATFRVTDIDVNGSSADAHLSGSYEYVTSEGRTERQPVSFSASLHYDGSSWRLTSVR